MFVTLKVEGQWQKIDGPYHDDVMDLIIDPNHPDTLIAATFSGTGIYKTVNGGEEWVALEGGVDFGSINSLAHTPNDLDTIYAGGYTNLYKSFDRGDSWLPLEFEEEIMSLTVGPFTSNIIYAGAMLVDFPKVLMVENRGNM